MLGASLFECLLSTKTIGLFLFQQSKRLCNRCLFAIIQALGACPMITVCLEISLRSMQLEVSIRIVIKTISVAPFPAKRF